MWLTCMINKGWVLLDSVVRLMWSLGVGQNALECEKEPEFSQRIVTDDGKAKILVQMQRAGAEMEVDKSHARSTAESSHSVAKSFSGVYAAAFISWLLEWLGNKWAETGSLGHLHCSSLDLGHNSIQSKAETLDGCQVVPGLVTVGWQIPQTRQAHQELACCVDGAPEPTEVLYLFSCPDSPKLVLYACVTSAVCGWHSDRIIWRSFFWYSHHRAGCIMYMWHVFCKIAM